MAKSEDKAVATIPAQSPIYGLANKFNIEPSKLLAVLKGTVIKPDTKGREATNEEVAAFCIVAQQYGLNPFTREIHAFTSNGSVVPIVGIDGWTHIVNARGDFDGCEFDEVGGADGSPDRITCRMFVKDREHPVCATERYSECKRPTIPWQTMPWRMLRHKAYIQAARYAFGLSGIFDEDEGRDIIRNHGGAREAVAMPREIEQTVEVESVVVPERPAAVEAPNHNDPLTVTAVIDSTPTAAKKGKVETAIFTVLIQGKQHYVAATGEAFGAAMQMKAGDRIEITGRWHVDSDPAAASICADEISWQAEV